MKRFLIALFAILFTPLASAQCSLTATEVDYDNGTVIYKGASDYPGSLLPEEADWLNKKGNAVTAEVWKNSDKGGPYRVELKGTITCDGKTSPMQEGVGDGITAAGLAKIHRAALKFGADVIKASEDCVAKGHKKAWGDKNCLPK